MIKKVELLGEGSRTTKFNSIIMEKFDKNNLHRTLNSSEFLAIGASLFGALQNEMI